MSAFWARRARRIPPAALVTLPVCAIATIVFVPLAYWPQFLNELRANTAYVQNGSSAAGTGVGLVVVTGAMSHLRGEVRAAERVSARILTSNPKCFRVAARDPRRLCSNLRLR